MSRVPYSSRKVRLFLSRPGDWSGGCKNVEEVVMTVQ